MSVFTTLRTALAAELSTPLGLTVQPAWPDVLDPPCAFITPPLSGDLARRGPQFGTITVNFDLVLLVPHGEPVTALTALEALIHAALVYTADWILSGVDSPSPVTVSEGGAEYLGSVLHLGKTVTL